VAIDPGDIGFYADRAFDPVNAERFPGTVVWATLRRILASDGIPVVTADRIDALAVDPSIVHLLTLCFSPVSRSLLERGAHGTILKCWESPHVAWRFYREVGHLARAYRAVWLFPSMLARVPGHRGARSAFVPMPHREVVHARDWSERELIAAVATRGHVPRASPLALVDAIAQRVTMRRPSERQSIRRLVAFLRDPALGSDLYPERERAFRSFAQTGEFTLYGRGWDAPGVADLVRRAYRGPVEDKLATLAGYRFGLCLENAAHDGYVTEKIFDAMFAGCIPVYLGAPDIERFVPLEAFIHVRRFRSYEDLTNYVRSLSRSEFVARLEAVRTFLASPRFNPFFHENIAAEMRQIILETLG
jgi:hypothetical protein